jgi:hypothetical protein
MEVSGQIHASTALARVYDTRYPTNRSLRGPQSRYGHCGEEKNLLPLEGIEPQLPRLSIP